MNSPRQFCTGEWEGPRAGLDITVKKKIFPLPEIEPRLDGGPVYSLVTTSVELPRNNGTIRLLWISNYINERSWINFVYRISIYLETKENNESLGQESLCSQDLKPGPPEMKQ